MHTKKYIFRKRGLILLFTGCLLTTYAQMPIGAKETFHLKIEQENRANLYMSELMGINGNKSTGIKISNGAMLELGYRQVTIGASFLNNPLSSNSLGRIDLDLGYEGNLTSTFKLQPFLGFEMIEAGTGFTTGAKLNKDFNVFDNISLGLFAGVRYSSIKSNTPFRPSIMKFCSQRIAQV